MRIGTLPAHPAHRDLQRWERRSVLKKKINKLALHRETLARLTQNDLEHVAGGAGITNPPNCDFSNRQTCATCDRYTCTTNYC